MQILISVVGVNLIRATSCDFHIRITSAIGWFRLSIEFEWAKKLNIDTKNSSGRIRNKKCVQNIHNANNIYP